MIILYSDLSIKPEKDLNAAAAEAQVAVNSVYIALDNMEGSWLVQIILSLVRDVF